MIVVDTSALVAILRGEADAGRFAAAIADADPALVSAATVAETAIVMLGRHGQEGADKVRALLREGKFQVESVTEDHAELAIEAYDNYGKGRGRKAKLNLGDCFSYALAKATGSPLLFKGADFTHTDLAAVP